MFLALPLQPTIIEERAVFLRERAEGLYTPATYLASGEFGTVCWWACAATYCLKKRMATS